MISKNTVKSNASSVHPSQAAHHASHWSLVGSLHQGSRAVSAIAIAHLSFHGGSFAEPCSPPPRQVCVLVFRNRWPSPARSGDHEIRYKLFPAGLGAKQYRQDEAD